MGYCEGGMYLLSLVALWTIEVSFCRETLRREKCKHTKPGQSEEAWVGACMWVGVERISYPREDTEVDYEACRLGPYIPFFERENRNDARSVITPPIKPGRG